MPDIAVAVDNLIANGFSDDDIETVIDQINRTTDELIKQNKSDEEIERSLSQTGLIGKDGNRIQLFNTPTPQTPAQPQEQPFQPFANQPFNNNPNTRTLSKEELIKKWEGEGIETTPIENNPLVGGVGGSALMKGGSLLARTGLAALGGLGVGTVGPFTRNPTDPYKALKEVPQNALETAATYGVMQPITEGFIGAGKLAKSGVKRLISGSSKKIGNEATQMAEQGLKLIPNTNQVAQPLTAESDRMLITATKGPVGSLAAAIEKQVQREELTRQSQLGQHALEQDLSDQVARSVDPHTKLNLNNAQVNYLNNQLETLEVQYTNLSRNIKQLAPNSRVPATNLLQKMEGEIRAYREQVSALNMENNELMPQISAINMQKKAVEDAALNNAEVLNAGLREVVYPYPELKTGALPLDQVTDIENEVLRRGRQYLSDSVRASDIEPPPIAGSFQSGFNALDEATKINNLANKITLDVGKGVRLKDGTIGKIEGLHSSGNIKVSTEKGIRYVTQHELQVEELRYVASEPRIVGTKIENDGKIKLTSESNLTDKQAFEAMDVPTITIDDAASGKYINSKILESKSSGLDSMSKPLGLPKNAQNRPLANDLGTGGPKIPVDEGSSIVGQSGVTSQQLDTLLYKQRPTWRVAADFENKSGVPTFTKLFLQGRKASDEFMKMKLEWNERVDKIFKKEGLNGYTNKIKASQSRVTEALEKINSTDALLTPPQIVNKLKADGVNVNLREAKAAMELRKLYDEAMGKGSIDVSKYIEYYSPRRTTPDKLVFDFVRNSTTDYKPFFQHARTGELMPRETNANILAHRYFDSWARGTHLNPWHENVAKPMIDVETVIPNMTAREYFKNYMFDVMRYPRNDAVEASDGMARLINNTIGLMYGNPKLADDIIKRLGDERMSEVVVNKIMSYGYKHFLGYRPLPALRNATQKIFSIPLLKSGNIPFSGEANLARGRILASTKVGQDKVLASGIAGSYQELGALEVIKSKLHPVAMYKGVETKNKASVYLPIHDNVLSDFLAGKSFKEVSEHINLRYYHPVVRKEFQRLYEAGLVHDVRDGTANNAAHFLGDMAQIMTQFGYEKGSGPEMFRRSPGWKAAGMFQSWFLLTSDYMGNLAKEGHAVDIIKMFGYYYMLDMAMENVLGISLHSNPVFSIPVIFEDNAPTTNAVRNVSKIVVSHATKLTLEAMEERGKLYQWFDSQQKRGEKDLMNIATPGVFKDISKALKNETVQEVLR